MKHLPKIHPISDESDSVTPAQAAETVRKNVTAQQITLSDPQGMQDFNCLHHEMTRLSDIAAGLSEKPFSSIASGLRIMLSNEDARVFVLKYKGPVVKIQQPMGVVEVSPGNVLGVHLQRLTGYFPDELFRRTLDLKAQGASHETLYRETIPDHEERHRRYRSLLNKSGFFDLKSGVALSFDRFSYDQLSIVNERNFGMSEPNAAFLKYVQVLPTVRRMGLAEVFIDKALKNVLDSERLRYVVSFARIEGLFEKHAKQDSWKNFERYTQFREKDKIDDMPVQDREMVVKTARELDPMQVQRDLEDTRADGNSIYRTIRFHQLAGGQFICGVPFCTMTDAASLFTGALMMYDLKDLRKKGKL